MRAKAEETGRRRTSNTQRRFQQPPRTDCQEFRKRLPIWLMPPLPNNREHRYRLAPEP